jgi:hypothetical protein
MGGYDGVEAGVLLPVGCSLVIEALRGQHSPEGLSTGKLNRDDV